MAVLVDALLRKASGEPIQCVERFETSCWDELSEWSNAIFAPSEMTYHERTHGLGGRCGFVKLGRLVLSRTQYGTPVQAECAGTDISHMIVTTTLRGEASHRAGEDQVPTVVGPGEALVVRSSEFGHFAELSADCIRLNITIAPDLLEEISLHWFGCSVREHPLPSTVKIGGPSSGWMALMSYLVSVIEETPDQVALSRLGRHLETTICVHVLSEMYNRGGSDLGALTHAAPPRCVRIAEAYMSENAAATPRLAEVAQAANISVRSLSQAFREARGYTVAQFLAEQRLQGVRRELLEADPTRKVSEIARSFGYVHLGEFAKRYRSRFGELPSETLRL
ncbi:AraC family transcriptional regulator [Shimia aestuarii]|uniref:AraC family transcriptional regulator n=1 Tax=Shimia aestuarii TaxID=254406 RepID=UPI001FB2B674|nr:helix-turn-helix transcriptional regulator [Shimia aestuarii]